MPYIKRIFSITLATLAIATNTIAASAIAVSAAESADTIDTMDTSINNLSDTTDTSSFTIEDFKQSNNNNSITEDLSNMDLSDLGDGTLTSEKLAETLSFSTEDILNSMHSALSGDDTSLSEVLQNYTPFEIDMDAYYSIEDLELKSQNDFGTINLQYITLSNDLAQTQSNLDMSGFSRTAADAFNDTYGDLASQISLTTYSIPEGFSVDNILAFGSAQINSLYSSALSSDMFQTIKGNISISSVFAKAKEGVSTYSLASVDTLRNMMISDGTISKMDSESQSKYDTIAAQFDADLTNEQNKQNFEAIVYEHTGTNPDQIVNNQDYIDSKTEELKNDSDYADEVLGDYMDYILQGAENTEAAKAYNSIKGDLTFEDYLSGDTSTKGGAARALVESYSDVKYDGVESYTYPESYEDLAAFERALREVNQDGFDAETYGYNDPLNFYADVLNRPIGGGDCIQNMQEKASYVSQSVEKQKSNMAEYNTQKYFSDYTSDN